MISNQLELVEKFLNENFLESIDIIHPDKFKDAKRKKSAALSALALSIETGLPVEHCCKAIVDGFDDQGIDAVLLDHINKKVYLVQSKLVESGKKSPEKGDVLKFLEGIKQILGQDEKLLQRLSSAGINITDALDSVDYTFTLILVSTGTELQSKSEEPLKDFLAKQNASGSGEWVFFQEYNLQSLCEEISEMQTEADLELQISLTNYGEKIKPHHLIYGLVEASELGEIHKKFGNKLFFRNIRSFLGKGDVNLDIQNTLKTKREQFVYLNNGVTILCTKISKTRAFGSDTTAGTFSCKGVKIINGAQTVGNIGQIYGSKDIDLTDVKVFVRLISSEGTDDSFAQRITIATNTQNRIEKIDFASMEKHQLRLEKEMLKNLGVTYHRMRGDFSKTGGISMENAALSLACYESDVTISTYVKRQKSLVWDDLEGTLYKALFNPGTTSYKVFNVHAAMEVVNAFVLNKIKTASTSREKSFAKSVDVFLLHILLNKLAPKERNGLVDADFTKSIAEQINKELQNYYDQTWNLVKDGSSQLSRLFITSKSVQDLKQKIK